MLATCYLCRRDTVAGPASESFEKLPLVLFPRLGTVGGVQYMCLVTGTRVIFLPSIDFNHKKLKKVVCTSVHASLYTRLAEACRVGHLLLTSKTIL